MDLIELLGILLLQMNGYACSYMTTSGEHDIATWRECIKMELSR